ncbi:hypothetical protein [Mucilaginibacter ginsenosidivorax]|uniref:Uncharacterized protein n=1 Tax=Mucilaginibacter ginsenosidivorax TaxID=862126 RepID=A0A5B8VZP4_9SPHI|nr:hypothetical protein [Mucilaginibacter ginsenosidivorax]QEC76863.1 hypothetical protein FSB76_13245 [Mucilaginibacter ginsenosidivorax]
MPDRPTTLPQQSHKTGQRDSHIRRPAGAGHIFELVPGGVNGGIERWGAQIGQVPMVVDIPFDLDQRLIGIGFTGESIKLKAALLNKLWKKIVDRYNSNGQNLNLFDGAVKKLIKKFLNYLNSLLGSILSGIPGGEAIKEIKEFLEEYADEEE